MNRTSSTNPSDRPRRYTIAAFLILGAAAGAAGMREWMNRRSPRDAASPTTAQNDPARSTDKSAHPENKAGGPHEHSDGTVHLSPEARATFGVEIAQAGPGKLERTITLPGEVRLNADKVAHIVPRVSGMVREVRKQLGDPVAPGEVLTVLDSRELADAKAADLAAASRHELARANVERIQKLFSQKIAPEEELLRAKQTLAETDIDHRTAEAKLHALGLTQEEVEKLHDEKDTDYSRYQIKAPFSGVVIEKHVTLGEVVSPETSVFVLADLSDLWIDVTVYPQDVPHVLVGNAVQVAAPGLEPRRAEIAYVSPKIDEETRTGMARIVLPNPDQRWRPGMFVSVELVVSAAYAPIVVPNSAIQTIDNQPVVFVEDDGNFVKRPIVAGRTTGSHTEVLQGLSPGERFAATNTFILKAELGKADAEHSH